mmetsp:Transcript_54301/g.174090  ORF Transcript_54301/g.174090 Transcript_54301/m.174090 type:complete len:233 (-) Transcript_54301:1984-2682(-)
MRQGYALRDDGRDPRDLHEAVHKLLRLQHAVAGAVQGPEERHHLGGGQRLRARRGGLARARRGGLRGRDRPPQLRRRHHGLPRGRRAGARGLSRGARRLRLAPLREPLPRRVAPVDLLDLHRRLVQVGDELVRRGLEDEPAYVLQGLHHPALQARALHVGVLVDHGELAQEVLDLDLADARAARGVPRRVREDLACEPVQLHVGEAQVKHAQDLPYLFELHAAIAVGVEELE